MHSQHRCADINSLNASLCCHHWSNSGSTCRVISYNKILNRDSNSFCNSSH
jgi:hypothetical protein